MLTLMKARPKHAARALHAKSSAEAGLSDDGDPKYAKLEFGCGFPHRLGGTS